MRSNVFFACRWTVLGRWRALRIPTDGGLGDIMELPRWEDDPYLLRRLFDLFFFIIIIFISLSLVQAYVCPSASGCLECRTRSARIQALAYFRAHLQGQAEMH